jgi:hypothetical protein
MPVLKQSIIKSYRVAEVRPYFDSHYYVEVVQMMWAKRN